MLGIPNDSVSGKKRNRVRAYAQSSAAQHKVNNYMANTSLESPAGRVFKQVERLHSHERYQRLIYAVIATVALISLLGGIAGLYFGYYLLGITLLCATGGISAFNQWLTNTIPEHKVGSQPCQVKPQVPVSDCPNNPSKVIFHGVAYPIKYQCEVPVVAADTVLTPPLPKPVI